MDDCNRLYCPPPLQDCPGTIKPVTDDSGHRNSIVIEIVEGEVGDLISSSSAPQARSRIKYKAVKRGRKIKYGIRRYYYNEEAGMYKCRSCEKEIVGLHVVNAKINLQHYHRMNTQNLRPKKQHKRLPRRNQGSQRNSITFHC